MKTSELNDIALDWAVTSIVEPESLRFGVDDWRDRRRTEVMRGEYVHRYHQSWMQAGPLIEREEIDIYCHERNSPFGWHAEITGTKSKARGSTPLIAAMRCLVVVYFGDEVEIPEELR